MNLSNIESSTSTALPSEDDSSSSISSIFNLQQQIINQSQSIKKILQECQANQKGQSFSLFDSLFQLFQSEIAMNLALRKEIINERNNSSKSDDALIFFSNLSQLLGFPVNSFQQAFKIILELKSRNEKSKKGQNIENSSSEYLLDSQLSTAKSEINSLKCQLERANAIIFKQKSAINELKLNNNEYKNFIKDEIRDANLCHTNEIHNDHYIFKLETKNQKLKNTIANLQNEIKSLKEQFDMGSNDSYDEENNCFGQKYSKSSKMKSRNLKGDIDNIELLISQNKKLKTKLDFYKQAASNYKSENEKLQHQLKIKSECHWSNSSIKDAFRNIQDILGLDPDASPCDTYSAVSSLVCRLHNCM